MNAILTWIRTNPVLFTLIIWPVITALFTDIARKRTPEEYAAMNPRVAAFLRFVGAIGFNAPEALETIKLLITGGSPPPSKQPPSQLSPLDSLDSESEDSSSKKDTLQ